MSPTLRFLLLLVAVLPGALLAQPDTLSPGDAPQRELFAARPEEKRLVERLAGLRFVAAPSQLSDPGFPADGIDVVRVRMLQPDSFPYAVAGFLDKPVSQESLDRLVLAVRVYLRMRGQRFVSVYLPPQDITGGHVQVVVEEARMDGSLAILHARYFSEASYRGALRQTPDGAIDTGQLAADLAWLSRNPFRRAVVSAQPGSVPGSTRLVLVATEQRPWQVSGSYDNTGTASTDEDRVSAGVTWGNALGRGDLMSYRFTADPDLEHSIAHSGTYTAFLPWRHVLSLFGAHSKIESLVTPPFAQRGRSWQVGARYEIPLRAPREGWTQNLSVSADFKYTDNNLEFATIPVINNATHIAQIGASYGVGFPAFGGRNSASATVYVSPGGLTDRNRDRAFNDSRFGAKAEYVYGQLALSHLHPLPLGWSWTTAVNAQWASGALLGSEQLNGGGTYAVRGYRESSAFGDWGAVLNNELHAPPVSLAKGRDRLDGFVFFDAASLNLRVDRESTDLRSAGIGVNYQFGRHFSFRAAYGWQMKELPNLAGDSSHGHIGANVSF